MSTLIVYVGRGWWWMYPLNGSGKPWRFRTQDLINNIAQKLPVRSYRPVISVKNAIYPNMAIVYLQTSTANKTILSMTNMEQKRGVCVSASSLTEQPQYQNLSLTTQLETDLGPEMITHYCDSYLQHTYNYCRHSLVTDIGHLESNAHLPSPFLTSLLRFLLRFWHLFKIKG